MRVMRWLGAEPSCGRSVKTIPESFRQRLARSVKAGLTPDVAAESRGDAIVVKEYSDRAAYQRGVGDMASRGYIVVSVVEHGQRAGCLRILTLGLFALVWRPKAHFVVTYQRR